MNNEEKISKGETFGIIWFVLAIFTVPIIIAIIIMLAKNSTILAVIVCDAILLLTMLVSTILNCKTKNIANYDEILFKHHKKIRIRISILNFLLYLIVFISLILYKQHLFKTHTVLDFQSTIIIVGVLIIFAVQYFVTLSILSLIYQHSLKK